MYNDGKTALVTGGSRGIGRATAITLAETGAFMFVNYREDTRGAEETLRTIMDNGGNGEICRFDISDFQGVHEAIEEMIDKKGSMDILVNNASVSIDGLFVRTKEQDWDTIINTNLKGTFNCCRAVVKHMMKQRRGRIINISSVVAEMGNAGQACYSTSKAGIIGLTKSLARELGPRNILVNAIAPGFITTDMTASISDEIRNKLIEQIPLSRLGTPRDVAGVVAFLSSPDADYITGQVIHVNGGGYM
ncbi:MAG TPA: 3-oxoacyl-[acyl-carrier-protein] reductase [Deltaproteobacteria bacterium]|nr:3-oxoacyl-[acyl-carrier-protein] reductase [Deltaproteobacteria bacterium]